MYVDLSLDHRVLKDVIEKKALKPCDRKSLVEEILLIEKINISRVCKIIHLTRSMFFYQTKKDDSLLN